MEKVETKTIHYCDICGRESNIPLTKCPVCGKEGCYTCTNQLYDVYHMSICKSCLEQDMIKASFMELWRKWGKERNKAIKQLKSIIGV